MVSFIEFCSLRLEAMGPIGTSFTVFAVVLLRREDTASLARVFAQRVEAIREIAVYIISRVCCLTFGRVVSVFV